MLVYRFAVYMWHVTRDTWHVTSNRKDSVLYESSAINSGDAYARNGRTSWLLSSFSTRYAFSLVLGVLGILEWSRIRTTQDESGISDDRCVRFSIHSLDPRSEYYCSNNGTVLCWHTYAVVIHGIHNTHHTVSSSSWSCYVRHDSWQAHDSPYSIIIR